MIVQSILHGIFMGSIYGLIALGLTIIFGVMKIINFAHGSLLMMSMFASYWFTVLTGLTIYLSLIIVCPLFFIFGYTIQKYLIKSVLIAEHDVREPIGVLLLTSGLWIFLDNFFMVLFGPDYRAVFGTTSSQNIALGENVLIHVPRLVAFLVSCTVTIASHLFLKFTEFGRFIRAVGQDRTMLALLGIDVHKIFNAAFGISTCIVAISGTMIIPFCYVHPTVGTLFGIRAFIIVVLGGLGSIPGAFFGGIIVGLIESVGTQFVSATSTEAIIYLIFLLFLFYRPSGLFGLKQEW
jgi:branched-chain amino acid transport system permease protein